MQPRSKCPTSRVQRFAWWSLLGQRPRGLFWFDFVDQQQQQSARPKHLFFRCTCHLSRIAGGGFSVDGLSAQRIHTFLTAILENSSRAARVQHEAHSPRQLPGLLDLSPALSPALHSCRSAHQGSHQRPFSALLGPFHRQRDISSGLCNRTKPVHTVGRSCTGGRS